MTNDGTQVDPDELVKLASTLYDHVDKIESVAERASGIDYNVNAFGLIGVVVTNAARDTAGRTVEGLHALGYNVTADAAVVAATGVDVRNNEDTQVNRFRGELPHG